ncbi:hypothetical protein BOX15_Mlig007928g2, partial [Macrostomum lignano]
SNCSSNSSYIAVPRPLRFVVLLVLLISALASAAIVLCFVSHHRSQPPTPCVSLSINRSAIQHCLGESAGGISAGHQNLLTTPCLTEEGLMLTDSERSLGPLVCDASSHSAAGDCKHSGFLLNDKRDVLVALSNGIYVIHSTVTFIDNNSKNHVTFSVMVNGKIRFDCASHSAHIESRNRFTACTVNGLLKLRRGDSVSFRVRSSYRSINLHKPATHFALYLVSRSG